ncbi:MAG: response regulator [Betaproteobacteria bacterium]
MSDLTCVPHPPDPSIQTCQETKKKVLIVDDEYLIRYSMQILIGHEGYEALTAESGLEALRLLEEHKPEIVILDVHLPDSNGLLILKTIKEISPSATVIMVTGCPDIESSVEAMKMGALNYLEKPINIDELKALMHATEQQSPREY